MNEHQREAYEERAGILEFCAGMTREDSAPSRVRGSSVLGLNRLHLCLSLATWFVQQRVRLV